jgi:diguanylate cyclase (GGDEF)-like protein
MRRLNEAMKREHESLVKQLRKWTPKKVTTGSPPVAVFKRWTPLVDPGRARTYPGHLNRMRTSAGEANPSRIAQRVLPALAQLTLPTPRYLLTLTALAGLYFVAAKLGLGFALVNPSATAIWPPTGITLAAFLILGLDVWPAILLGAFLANLTTQGSIATSLCIGVGNTLEGLVGAMLVNRFAHGRMFFMRPRDIVTFAALAAGLSTTVSPTIGVTTLELGGFARWADYGHIWVTWWLGDSAGDLIVAPVLVLWIAAPPLRWNSRWLMEVAALIFSLSVVALIVFDGLVPAVEIERLPLEFLCVPFLFWAAFRIGRRGVVTCVLALSWISIAGTLRGLGPFALAPPNESLLVLQAYLAVKSVTMLAAAAVVWQRRQAQEQSLRQAVSDELTGLANYRSLVGNLEGEIKRAQRAGRALTMLLLDMNGLKQVNDRFGHLVGNRALCRLAECLRASCRVTDTAARFGGDEFAIILPETSESGARQLAVRIADRLAADNERPPLSVGIGIAVFPRDGTTAENLLSAADRELYRSKAAARGEFRTRAPTQPDLA